jgi:hypothetical protein
MRDNSSAPKLGFRHVAKFQAVATTGHFSLALIFIKARISFANMHLTSLVSTCPQN